MKMVRWTGVLFLLIPILACGEAGKLESFRRGIENPRSNGGDPGGGSGSSDRDRDGDDGNIGGEVVGNMAGNYLSLLTFGAVSWAGTGVEHSLHMLGGQTARGAVPRVRQSGDARIPFFAAEFQYQLPKDGVDAVDSRIEAGFGPLGASARWTRFREEDLDDHLDLWEFFGHVRLTGADWFELSPGIGYGHFGGDGDGTGAFAMTFPLKLHFEAGPTQVGVEYRPAWVFVESGVVSDQEVAFVVGHRFVYGRVGYRWVFNDAETLAGPTLGLSLRW